MPTLTWLNPATASDLVRVFTFIVGGLVLPETLIDAAELTALVRRWRPVATAPQ